MVKSAITFEVISELITNYVENNTIAGNADFGEDMQNDIIAIINLCRDLQYYVREKTGADY